MIHPITIDKERIQKEVDYWRVPGMAVTLIQEGQPDQIACFGYRDVEKQLPVTPDTLFCVASCSKSMTAALIACLVDEGKLDWDVPVKHYVPHFRMYDEYTDENMTLRDMLSHQTGLPPHDALWPGTATREDLSHRMRFVKPFAGLRETGKYNNTVYALIGYVAEYVTGKSWETLMREYIFAPIGMERACCLADEITADENHAEPYRIREGQQVKVPFWNVDLAGPAASVNASPKDMARWIHFHIDGGRDASGKPIISEKPFQEMHKPNVLMPDTTPMPGEVEPCDYYCMGWRCGTYRGHALQKHSGKIEGYSTLQVYLPDDKVGIIFQMNYHEPSTEIFYTILFNMLDEIVGHEDMHWETLFHGPEAHPEEFMYHKCDDDLTTGCMDEAMKGQAEPFAWEDMVGVYHDPGYGDVTVTIGNPETAWNGSGVSPVPCSGPQLMLHYRDQNLILQHWGGNQYWMDNVLEDTALFKMPVTFQAGEDGKVASVAVRYEPLIDDICFQKK